eukprot:jgi/Tetstr1/440403/TSEL_028737.t1
MLCRAGRVLAALALLLALLAAEPPGREAKVRWAVSRREGRSGGGKPRARVVVVLGPGCPAAAVNASLEAACGATLAGNTTAWRKAGKDIAVWKEPSTECEALPVLTARAEREGARWEFNCDYKLAYSRVFRQAADRLRELGWVNFQVVEYKSSEEQRLCAQADVIVAPLVEYLADLRDRYAQKRFIVIHTDDAATINYELDLNSPLLAGVLMHTTFMDKGENNKPAPFNRRHSAWMLPQERLDNITATQREPPISNSALRAKIHTIIPQIQRWAHPLDCGGSQWFTIFQTYGFNQNSSFSPPLVGRPIDIAFLGEVGDAQVVHQAMSTNETTVYKESGRSKMGVRAHRQAAEEQMLAMAARHNLTFFVADSKLRYADYVDILRSTKVFLSPFGLGEFSGKDYEAILAGALVVKPMASALKSYPNIYTKQFMLETRADFTDLEQAVMPYLSSDHTLASTGQTKVADAQNRLHRAANITRFADDLDSVLEVLVLQSGPHNNL